MTACLSVLFLNISIKDNKILYTSSSYTQTFWTCSMQLHNEHHWWTALTEKIHSYPWEVCLSVLFFTWFFLLGSWTPRGRSHILHLALHKDNNADCNGYLRYLYRLKWNQSWKMLFWNWQRKPWRWEYSHSRLTILKAMSCNLIKR